MPSYSNSIFAPAPIAVQEGVPVYLFGGFDLKTANTRMHVTSVAIASNVATLGVTVQEGPIPLVGAPISVYGTQTGSGEFNVTNAPLTGVTINPVTGAGSVTFALTGSNVGPTADAGQAIVPQQETFETLANGASIPCALSANDPNTSMQRTIQAAIEFPTIPTAATVNLQAATRNVDSEYVNLGVVATVASGAVTQSQEQFPQTTARFLRFNVTGLSGAGTIVGKLVL